MKLLIAVPSKNRAEIFNKNVLPWLKEVGFDWRVFVEPQDEINYSFPDYLEENHLVRMPENNRGLGYAKAYIKKYARDNGYSHIFKVDDDVKGFTNYRRQVTGPDMILWIKKVIEQSARAFADERIGAVAFPYSFEMFEREGWTVTKRLQTAYIVPTELFHGDPAISVFEDFAQGLHILTQGRLLVKHGLAGIAMGVGVGKGTGGHQSKDRAPQALLEVAELRKIYPPLNFRKVDKPWKIEPDLSSVDLGGKMK